MKCTIEWKACVYCFLQTHCTLCQSMDSVCFCFTASKAFITRGDELTEPQFSVTFLPPSAQVSCRFYKLVIQASSKGVSVHRPCAYRVWSIFWKTWVKIDLTHSRIKLKRRWSKSEQGTQKKHRILYGSRGKGEGETSS